MKLDQVSRLDGCLRWGLGRKVGTKCAIGTMEPNLVINTGSDNGPDLQVAADIMMK